MNKLLTIIIPVYGVEKYIQEFLDSLFPQIEASIELIFVNDGTQDQSIMILNDSIDKHDINCLILNQSNAGVSSARNNALRVCTGQFVAFLDPEDVVSPKYIEKILDIITNHNDISIIHYNAYMKKENNEIVDMCFVDETSTHIINQEFKIKNFIKDKWQPWLRVFRKDLLKDFEFVEGYIFEDVLAFPFLYRDELKIYELVDHLLIYRFNESSLTAKKNQLFFASIYYAISFYRLYRNIKCFECVYFKLIECLYGVMLKKNFYHFLKFYNMFKEDIFYIKDHRCLNTFKLKFKYTSPLLFYMYKTKFFLKL